MYLEYRKCLHNLPALDVADVLTNQSADTRAQGYIGHCTRFALMSAHYWQLFKSYNHHRGAACVSLIRLRCQKRHSDTGQTFKTSPLRTFVHRFKLLSHIDAVITVLVLKTLNCIRNELLVVMD